MIRRVAVSGWRAPARRRAIDDARRTLRLDLPGTVPTLDVIAQRRATYVVTGAADTLRLDDLVERCGPRPPRTVAVWGLALLDCLQAMHRAGIVHRGVAPGRVVVRGDRARLTDVGVVDLVTASERARHGNVIGTAAFLAPEQLRGVPGGPAADLYGLGTTLYLAVEGVEPFGRRGAVTPEIPAVEPLHRFPQRAGELEEVLGVLLSADPAARGTVDELRSRLRRIATTRPVRAAVSYPSGAASLPATGGPDGDVVAVAADGGVTTVDAPSAGAATVIDVTDGTSATDIDWDHVYASTTTARVRRSNARMLVLVAAVLLVTAALVTLVTADTGGTRVLRGPDSGAGVNTAGTAVAAASLENSPATGAKP